MVIKKDYSLHENTLRNFKTIIGGTVNHITADGCFHNKATNTYGFSNSLIIPLLNISKHTALKVKATYNFAEHLNDEIDDLKFLFDNFPYYSYNYSKSHPFLFNQKSFTLYLQEDFVIKKVKIYGEERTCKWNKGMTQVFFNLPEEATIDYEVSDYLFSKEYLEMESTNGQKLVFKAERGGVTLNFTDIPLLQDKESTIYFYTKGDLDANYEDNDSPERYEPSDVPRLKLHYTIE